MGTCIVGTIQSKSAYAINTCAQVWDKGFLLRVGYSVSVWYGAEPSVFCKDCRLGAEDKEFLIFRPGREVVYSNCAIDIG